MSEELKYPETDDMTAVRSHVRFVYGAMRSRNLQAVNDYLAEDHKDKHIMVLVNVLRILAPGKQYLDQFDHAVEVLKQRLDEEGFTHPQVVKDVLAGIIDEEVTVDN